MWLYIVTEEGTSFLKIGFTNNLKRRQKELQAGNPRRLQLRYNKVFDPSKIRWVESVIHDRLRGYRRMGEWFEVDFTEAIKVLSEIL